MEERVIRATIGALLHDIGKVVFRAGESKERHAISGRKFLTDKAGFKDKEILDCVRYHHARDMSGAGLAKDSVAYVVYMADNIAAAADRREREEAEAGSFDRGMPLSPIFNLLRGNKGSMHYSPVHTNMERHINYPQQEEKKFEPAYYQQVLRQMEDNLKGLDWTEAYISSLLGVLEANLSFVPSSTNKKEVPDISLYDHLRLTAAFASSLELYLQEKGKQDYGEVLYRQGKDFYGEKAFALTVLDFSGIQKFIYTITSKNALKNLRARSFYLDIMMEHIADLLLDKMGLGRANLLYAGGGRCTLLLPNTKVAADKLQDFLKEVNAWFLQYFDISLYLAGCAVPCSCEDLQNQPEGSYASLYRQISQGLSEHKAHRYEAEDILALNSRLREEDTRECKVCRKAGKVNAEDRCEICEALEHFSAKILYDEFFMVGTETVKGALPLPGNLYLYSGMAEDVKQRLSKGNMLRVYGKNKFYTGQAVASKLWVGDYHTGQTFEELAAKSNGVRRLGVLRADVDDLGQAFASGFSAPDSRSNYQTLSRTAALSRQLSLFFKLHIKKILENPSFTLDGEVKEKRQAAIVYAGGDDLFIVGAWDDVLELAIDLRHAISLYSEGTLTISAGMGMYPAKYPISVMAEETAHQEEASKGMPGKDALTFLGMESYHWQALEDKVLGEKYKVVRDFFQSSDDRGKGFLYSLLELLRGRAQKINLARYVYLLSRMEPDSRSSAEAKDRYRFFADRMLSWTQQEDDVRQLQTAMQIYVYDTRETSGMGEEHEDNQ